MLLFNPNLFTPLPVGFPLITQAKSKTQVKAVILAFCTKFGISNSPQSPDIEQNSDGGIFDSRISGQPLVKENCYNSRTSDDIDMKLGPVTKLDKKNKSLKPLFSLMATFYLTKTELKNL